MRSCSPAISRATRRRPIPLGLAFCCLMALAWPSHAQTHQHSAGAPEPVCRARFTICHGEHGLDLFSLVDSLLALSNTRISSLSLRSGYMSAVTNAGRILGVEQIGLSSGASFYHHSGFFADLSGFFNSASTPYWYYLTSASLGYSHTVKNKWLNSLSYDRYLYHDTLAHSFNQSLALTSLLDLRWATLATDYNYLWGTTAAHRISLGLNANLRKKDFWIFDAIRFYPGVNLQWGNATVVFIRQPEAPLRELFQIMTDPQISAAARPAIPKAEPTAQPATIRFGL
ncbi:MAG: hypothetical protein HC842_01190 [Cytophagales bacterium]|nr:hypothetical protein [Cytophagales bacterium]